MLRSFGSPGIVGVMRQSGCEVPEWMLRLKAKPKKACVWVQSLVRAHRGLEDLRATSSMWPRHRDVLQHDPAS